MHVLEPGVVVECDDDAVFICTCVLYDVKVGMSSFQRLWRWKYYCARWAKGEGKA